MKITFCLESSFNSGGMERMLSVIANAVAEHEEVTVVTVFNEGRSDCFAFSSKVMRVDLGICRSSMASAKEVKKEYRRQLEQWLVQHRQDVTVSLGSLEFFFLPWLKDGSKKVFWFHFALNYDVLTCAITPWPWANNIIGKMKRRRRIAIARKYDRVVCLSKADLAKWRRHMPHVSQIYNPLTVSKWAEPDYGAHRVIAVGRLDRQKGFDWLISAWQKVHQKYPDWQLDIYGEGADRRQLQQQIDRLQLGGVVSLPGSTAEINREYARHSLMVLSSRYEGFGLVLCEAAVCGVAQVAFDCESGPAEIIDHGKSGLLVSPVGNIDGLADALCQLMADEDKRCSMGKWAEVKARQWALDVITGQWLDLFHGL